MTALIVVGCIAAYLVVGAVYARSMAVTSYHRERQSFDADLAHDFARVNTMFRMVCWPGFVPYDFLRSVIAPWLIGPLDDRRARSEQLRRDAAAWRDKQYTGTPAEREMAAELARLCEHQAREMDL